MIRRAARALLFAAVVAGVMLSSKPAAGANLPAWGSWPAPPSGLVGRLLERFPHPNRHIARANRYLERCLASTAPAGQDAVSWDRAQGEFVVWWGAGEYQTGTVQVWWAHWPKRDHNPTLAGVMFSTYGVPLDGPVYAAVDRCTGAAVNRDEERG